MAYIPSTNVVQGDISFIIDGQTVEITVHVAFPTAVVLSTLNLLAANILNWWDTSFRSIISDELNITGVTLTDLTTATSASIFYPYAGSNPAGVVTGGAVPNNATAVVTKRTDSRGRSFRGRNYIPGVPDAAVNDAVQLSSTFVVDALLSWASLDAALAGSGGTPVVLSKFTAGAPRGHGVATNITAYSMDDLIDSQRRRLAGRGA